MMSARSTKNIARKPHRLCNAILELCSVMPGLVPGIHAVVSIPGAWMAGTSPAMTA
jgi:hypothetical protein